MFEPMAANTLSESAEWLTEVSGRTWNERRVLDEVIRRSEMATTATPAHRMTAAFVLPPKSTPFSVYELGRNGEQSEFRVLHLNYKFPLSLNCAIELFDYEESEVTVASFPSGGDRRLVRVEPQDTGLTIESRMVRLGRVTLLDLATTSSEQGHRPYLLPPYNMLGPRSEDDNRAETWWSLRVLATHYGWNQKDSRPVIERCLSQLPFWDGSVVRTLIAGPSVAERFSFGAAPLASVKHIQKRRIHLLDAEIAHARTLAIDPDDSQAVFGALCKLAEQQYGVLLGLDERAIKYRKGDEVAFFSFRQLNARMFRAKQAKSG